MNSEDKVTISLDFDGVLHNYSERESAFPVPAGKPVEGSLAMVGWLIANRYDLVLHSARANEEGGPEAIKNWLRNWGFPNIPISLQKPEAACYIDDRGFRFNGNCNKVIEFLTKNPVPGRWGKK